MEILQPILLGRYTTVDLINFVAHGLELEGVLCLASSGHKLVQIPLVHHAVIFKALVENCTCSMSLSLERPVLLCVFVELSNGITIHRTVGSTKERHFKYWSAKICCW